MGIRDRDYMKRQPGDEDYRRYEQESQEVEYGDYAAKRKANIRRTIIIFLIILVAVFTAAVLFTTE